MIWVAGERVLRVPNDSSKGKCDERREVVGSEEWEVCCTAGDEEAVDNAAAEGFVSRVDRMRVKSG